MNVNLVEIMNVFQELILFLVQFEKKRSKHAFYFNMIFLEFTMLEDTWFTFLLTFLLYCSISTILILFKTFEESRKKDELISLFFKVANIKC